MINFPNFDSYHDISYKDSFWDDREMSSLNNTIIQTALKLKTLNKELISYEREKVGIDIQYKKKFRHTLLSAKGKTESQKKILAEIECEDLEERKIYLDEVIKELKRMSEMLRIDLDTLKTIGHNLRQELRI